MKTSRPRLCAAGVQLRKQIDLRWPKRDRASDGWIGDKAHQARKSDHNPDAAGWVRALDIDADLQGPGHRVQMQRLADELVAYAKSGLPGSDRIKYIVYNDRIASGTYSKTFWTWRGKGYGHMHHLHVSFTEAGDSNGKGFPLQILGR